MYPKHIQDSIKKLEEACIVSNYDSLKRELKHVSGYAIHQYKGSCEKLGIQDGQLEEATWKHLKFAVRKYLEKVSQNQEKLYRFEEYYAWFARQGVVELLNKVKKEKIN